MGKALLVSASIFTALIFGLSHVEAQGSRDIPFKWPVWDYPDPHSLDTNQQSLCRRNNISSVCDPNGIIRSYEADKLDRLITNVYRNTTCQCMDCRRNNHGYIIRVAIMPRMQRIFDDSNNSSMARLRDARMYAYILSLRWRLDGACNETLLILYSKHDDILFTLTREATRIRLTDNDITRISISVRHYFDDDETIAEGLMEMINRYRLVFQNQLAEAFLPSSAFSSGRSG